MKNKIIKVVLSCALILAVGLFFINKHTDNSDDFDKTNSQNYSRVDVEPTAKPIIEMNEENESSQMRTEEFMVEVVEIIEEEPTEEVVEVVPEEDFIVEVEEPTLEPTEAPKVEEPKTEEPAPTATPAPQTGNNGAPAGLTPEAQALWDKAISQGGTVGGINHVDTSISDGPTGDYSGITVN